MSLVNATVPVASGSVIVLSCVGSVTVNVVSLLFPVAPSNLKILLVSKCKPVVSKVAILLRSTFIVNFESAVVLGLSTSIKNHVEVILGTNEGVYIK